MANISRSQGLLPPEDPASSGFDSPVRNNISFWKIFWRQGGDVFKGGGGAVNVGKGGFAELQ